MRKRIIAAVAQGSRPRAGRLGPALALLVAAVWCLTAMSGPAEEIPQSCQVAAGQKIATLPLSKISARLEQGLPVVIVAIGSSSTGGAGASSQDAAYPERLEALLRERYPGRSITVLNRGVNGEVEPQMLARFDRDVFAHHPDLVIWQVGANAVLRGMNLDDYQKLVRQGLDRLHDADIETLLMDLQYSPRILSKPRFKEFITRMETVAREKNVAVFHRFAIMRNWLTHGRLYLDEVLSPDMLHMNDHSYDCVARLLAWTIADYGNDFTASQWAGMMLDAP
ncbi:MAG: SGNH/GDSL hydrolase family protein [Azospirillum sp.]|nr:SGNH/GDSL hydrolase family protein [Azospirillum sp.]